MPRKPAPTLIEEFPSVDLFQALITRFETFADDPVAQFMAKACQKGVELHRKEAKVILKHDLAQSDSAPKGVAELDSRLRNSNNLLERVLVREGHRTEVDAIKKDYAALGPRTEQLVKLSADSKNESVRALRKEAESDLKRYTEAQARVQSGGHPFFDAHATAVARKLWATLDNGYDGLAICLRNAGISEDPVLATRPTIKTPLRPVLNAPPKVKHKAHAGKKVTPATKAGGATAKPAAPAAKAKGGRNEVKVAEPAPKEAETPAVDPKAPTDSEG